MNVLKFLASSAVLFGAISASCAFAAEENAEAPGAGKETPPFADIFNGKDLTGWVVEGTTTRGSGDDKSPVWTVKDGEIRCAGGGFGFLRFDRAACDFTLKAEIKLEPKANSGIGIRTVPFRTVRQTRPSFAAYEVQIQDDAGAPADKHCSGSLYRYVAPTENAMKPAGEWNTVEITCTGPRIVIKINDRTVQDVDQSKIEEIKNKPLCGYICLQNHGSPAVFRKVQMQVMKAAE
ncbi:MAG TPA: DUF1080 domain-containing protein [Pirellulales bacterium]|jgi:hypothetical protein